MKITLMENGLDFILAGVEQVGVDTERGLKYAVLHFSSGVELLLKERLRQEHWTLIFSDVNKASQDRLESGKFHSVNFEDALTRLKEVCRIDLSKHEEILNTLRDIRNRLEHYQFVGTKEGVLSILVKGWSFVLDFIHDHLHDGLKAADVAIIEKIKTIMVANKNFVDHREEEIQEGLKKVKKNGAVLSCPTCLQDALAITGEDPECLFCRYTDEAEMVADKWCSVFIGYPYTDPKEHDIEPVLFQCPECASEAFIKQEDGNMSPPDPAWICFGCGLSASYDEIKMCDRCGEPFVSDDGPGMCPDCWSAYIKSDHT